MADIGGIGGFKNFPAPRSTTAKQTPSNLPLGQEPTDGFQTNSEPPGIHAELKSKRFQPDSGAQRAAELKEVSAILGHGDSGRLLVGGDFNPGDQAEPASLQEFLEKSRNSGSSELPSITLSSPRTLSMLNTDEAQSSTGKLESSLHEFFQSALAGNKTLHLDLDACEMAPSLDWQLSSTNISYHVASKESENGKGWNYNIP